MTMSEPIASIIDNDGNREEDDDTDEVYDNDKLNVLEDEKEEEEECFLCFSSMVPYDTSHPMSLTILSIQLLSILSRIDHQGHEGSYRGIR